MAVGTRTGSPTAIDCGFRSIPSAAAPHHGLILRQLAIALDVGEHPGQTLPEVAEPVDVDASELSFVLKIVSKECPYSVCSPPQPSLSRGSSVVTGAGRSRR